MNCQVRHATLDDLPSIHDELDAFAEFYGTKKNLYANKEHGNAVIEGMVKDHLFLVAEVDGNVVGLMSGYLVPHMYNPDIKTLVETFWWVNPSSRNTRAGAMLLKEYIDYGKKNVDWIICTIENGSPINEDTFLKRGFKLKEKSYLMEVH